jgi:hypothetical protein
MSKKKLLDLIGWLQQFAYVVVGCNKSSIATLFKILMFCE